MQAPLRDRVTLLDALADRMGALASTCGPELRATFAGVLARHGHKVESLNEKALFNPLSHPMIELPLWVAASGRVLPERSMIDIAESSLCGYLFVRAQDDLLDEALGDPGTTTLLASVLMNRHQALLARMGARPRFWDLFEARWREYAVAMASERKFHSREETYGEAEFEAVLKHSQPLEIPAAAVLDLQDRWEMTAQLGTFVRFLVRAVQTFNDFQDAPDDLARGNHTWMVRRLGGLDQPDQLVQQMMIQSQTVVDEINVSLDSAQSLATDMSLVGASEWIHAFRTEIASRRGAMLNVFFELARTITGRAG